MDVLIVSKRSIAVWTVIAILLSTITFAGGYFLGRNQTTETKIDIDSIMPKDGDINVLPSKPEPEEDPEEKPKQPNSEKAPSEKALPKKEIKKKEVKEKSAESSNKSSDKKTNEARTASAEATKAENKPTPTTKPTAVQKGFAIQVGAFGNTTNAEKYLEKLSDKGYEVFIHEDKTNEKNKLPISVRIGFYKSYNRAMEEAKTFKAVEGKSAMVVNRTIDHSDKSQEQ